MFEIVAGTLTLLALLVIGVWLLTRRRDPSLDHDEAAGLITGNWDRIDDDLF